MPRTHTIRRLCRIILPAVVVLLAGVAARPAAAQAGAAPTTTGSFSGPYTLLANANTPGNSAWFTGPVSISFTAVPGTGGSGLTTVYTLDGSGPLTYSVPLSLTGDGPHTVTFYSTDALGDAEGVNTQTLSIDTTPPVTTATGTSTVTLSATDAVSGVAATFYTLDGGAAQTYSQPVALAAGATHQVRFWSVDRAGNVEAAHALSQDLSAPTTTASVSGPAGKGGWYVGPVTVTLAATDPDGPTDVAATFYTLDGGATQAYSTPVGIGGDGAHSFVFWSVDQAGNAEAAHTLPLKIDATPPALSFGAATPAPNAAGWNRTPVAFPWTATDATSGLSGAATGTATVSAAGKGQTATVTVADAAGNSLVFTTPGVNVDLTPPVTTSTVAGAVVTLSVMDALSGVAVTDYTLDGGATLTYAGPVTVTGGGSHTLTFWSVDVAGNTEAKHTLPLTVAGLAAATVTLKTSLGAAVYGQAVTLTMTVASAKTGGGTPTGTVTVSEGGNAFGSTTLAAGVATLPLPLLNVGTHTLTAAYSGDTAFLAATSAALAQKISQSATTITMTASSPSALLGHSVTFTFTVAPAAPGAGVPTGTVTLLDKYHTTLGPVTLSGGQATLTTSGLIIGPHVLTAVYNGDTNFVRSTAAIQTVTVTAAKIMPMGDGLTIGYSTNDPPAQANGGYRGPLYAQTIGQGWAAQYVGSVVGNLALGGCEGHAGWTIEMAQAREPAYVTQYQPDVILLMSGIDDLEEAIPATQMLTDMGTLLDALSAAKPGVQIVVASLTPLDAPSIDPAQTAAYNAGLPSVVQAAAGRGDRVSFVDMHTLCGWVTSDYELPLGDGVHPDSSGYGKMAAVWYNALAALPLAR